MLEEPFRYDVGSGEFVSTIKKDPEQRRAEHLATLAAPLFTKCATHCAFLCSTLNGSYLIEECLRAQTPLIPEDSLGAQSKLLDALLALVSRPLAEDQDQSEEAAANGGEEEGEEAQQQQTQQQHILMDYYGSRLLNRLVASAPPCASDFALRLLSSVPSPLSQWATRRGSDFVLVRLLEHEHSGEKTRQALLQELESTASLLSVLQKAGNPGARILVKNLGLSGGSSGTAPSKNQKKKKKAAAKTATATTTTASQGQKKKQQQQQQKKAKVEEEEEDNTASVPVEELEPPATPRRSARRLKKMQHYMCQS